MQMIERRLNKIIAKNPQLINSLDRGSDHHLIRKLIHIPFKNYKMYIANVTDDYDNMTPTNCTDNEYNIDIIIPTLLFTIPCGVSFFCFMSFIVYTLIKPYF